jgi:DNA-binding CsgD family transcriptional regulator
MSMSYHTVVTHVHRTYEKLGVHSRAEFMDKLLKPEPDWMRN